MLDDEVVEIEGVIVVVIHHVVEVDADEIGLELKQMQQLVEPEVDDTMHLVIMVIELADYSYLDTQQLVDTI